jgi:hypothetical protein
LDRHEGSFGQRCFVTTRVAKVTGANVVFGVVNHFLDPLPAFVRKNHGENQRLTPQTDDNVFSTVALEP